MATLRSTAIALAISLCPFLQAQDKPARSAAATEATAAKAALAPPAQGPVGGTLVGVVDVVAAIEQYPKYQQLKAKLNEMGKAMEERLKQLESNMKEMQAQYQASDQDGEQARQLKFELDIARQQHQFLFKSMREKLDIEEERARLEVYQDAERAVAKVARARGVQLVLRTYDLGAPIDPAKASPKAIAARLQGIEVRQVWFAGEQVDLTSDLIKEMMVPIEAPKPNAADANAPPAKADDSKGKPNGGRG